MATHLVLHTTPRCPMCGAAQVLEVSKDALEKWEKGELTITQAFPTLTADEREALMTGIHAPCWEELFGGDEK